MENLPFKYCTLPNEFICRKYVALSTYSDNAIDIEVNFSINIKFYKKYITILIIEEIQENIDIGGGNNQFNEWKNKQKKIIINLNNFDFKYDYNNFIDITTNISNYINHYRFEYKRCGAIQLNKYDWVDSLNYVNSLEFHKKLRNLEQIPNIVNISMNNFLDFFILSKILAKKISKCIIIIISSFLIEDDIIKIIEF